MSNLDTILAFLTGKGLTPAQAAGVAGNLQTESNFSPTASNPREGAIGIAQWEGGRRTALDTYARNTHGSETDLNTQLGFLWSELQGSESNAYRKLIATSDPGSAASVFDQYYERSSGAARGTRMSNAQQIAAGHPTSTGGSSPSGGASTSAGVQNAGLFGIGSGWADDVARIALKVGAGAIAGALIVVGMKEAVRSGS